MLVTNDPDEAILLADRVIPLTTGPGATLGPSFPVDIPYPRDRRDLNHNGRFKELRREVTDFLLALRRDRQATWIRKPVLPDIEPEDLSRTPPWIGGRKRPIPRSEFKTETVETAS